MLTDRRLTGARFRCNWLDRDQSSVSRAGDDASTVPNAFNFSASPFDCLSGDERRLVRDSVDIAYFRAGATILEPGSAPQHLFVTIKGLVHQLDGGAVVASYGPDDCFDGRALVAGKASSLFVAAEEVLLYQIARPAVSELISRNATFGALLFADLSQKLSALAEHGPKHQLQSLAMARVEQAFIRPALVVDAADDIVTVVKLFHAKRTGNVLVRDTSTDPPRLGIFTTTGLQRAILDGTPLDQLPVGRIATFPLVTVKPGEALFDALALMIRHGVHRLVVADGERIVGFLEQLDLLSFLSNHSYLITLQILQAEDTAALAAAAEAINKLIALLWRNGTRVAMIARLVRELNDKLIERAWQLVAPPELVANSCLFVMGSEGRGEQLLKTDQDNGLVLRDGYAPPADLDAICVRFSQALADFGYPECPGGIMVRNPQWRHGEHEFAQTVRRWLLMPDAESLMALAIFIDAHAVCGDRALLESVRASVFELVSGNDVLIGRFAAAIDSFEDGNGWWTRLISLTTGSSEELDLKKAGLFPLVHGVRSLALEARLAVTGTVERIDALLALGRLPADLAPDLVECLHFLMGLRLKVGLDAMDAGQRDANGRMVVLGRVGQLDRDLLKDALAIVKRFKALLRQRYRLDAL